MDYAAQLELFRESITPDLYSPQDYIPWPAIEARVKQYAPALSAVQNLVDLQHWRQQTLADALLSEPSLLEVVRTLLAIPSGIGFEDGSEFPKRPPATREAWERLAGLLLDLGLPRLLSRGTSVADLLRVAAIAEDAEKRRFRLAERLNNQIDELLSDAIQTLQSEIEIPVGLLPQSHFPKTARGRVNHIITVDHEPKVAVNGFFQSLSGGRQQRDLELTYPTLQRQLQEIGLVLVLIADGRGVRDTPDRVLVSLFQAVGACMTLRQARKGGLVGAMRDAITSTQGQTEALASLQQIIHSTMAAGGEVEASDLPTAPDSARLALAAYARNHDGLALDLSPMGTGLRWERAPLVKRAAGLARANNLSASIELLGDLLGADSVQSIGGSNVDGKVAILTLPDDPILPAHMLVACFSSQAPQDQLRELSMEAFKHLPDSNLAAAILPEGTLPPGNGSCGVERRG